MKNLFIKVQSTLEIDKSQILDFSKKLPKKLAICYSIQYKKQASEIKKILSKTHNITEFLQILGCSRPKISSQAIILIGDGKFHATSLAIETKLPVYLYNIGKFERISEKDIKSFEQQKKASYVKFLNSDKVGVLISTKPGQQNLKKALELKNKIKNKKIHFFLCNNIDNSQFENFPEIQSWINTACPRLDMNDSRIVNINEI